MLICSDMMEEMKGKLIRDNVPKLASANGDELVVERIEDDDDFMLALREKLVEEVNEVVNAEGEEILEELADMAEVMRKICDTFGVSWEELEVERKRKLKKAGGFEQRFRLRARSIKKAKYET